MFAYMNYNINKELFCYVLDKMAELDQLQLMCSVFISSFSKVFAAVCSLDYVTGSKRLLFTAAIWHNFINKAVA